MQKGKKKGKTKIRIEKKDKRHEGEMRREIAEEGKEKRNHKEGQRR